MDERSLLIRLCQSKPGEEIAQAILAQRGETDWNELRDLAARHDVSPILHDGLKSLGLLSSGAVPADIASELERKRYATATANILFGRELERIAAALEAEGIPIVVLKGPVLAEHIYEDVSLRPFTDLDLVIRPPHRQSVRRILEGLGYQWQQRRDVEEDYYVREAASMFPSGGLTGPAKKGLKPSLQTGTGSAECEILATPQSAMGNPQSDRPRSRFWVDVHHRMDLNMRLRGRRYDMEEMWRDSAAWTLESCRRLGWEDCLCHLATHASLDFYSRFILVCDIDRLVRRRNDLDWDRALRKATEYRCRIDVWLALHLAASLLATPAPSQVLRILRRGDPRRAVIDHAFGAQRILEERARSLGRIPLRLATTDRLAELPYVLVQGLRLIIKARTRSTSSASGEGSG